jgi:hypothetical protein
MRECRQTPTQTVLEHGQSVNFHYAIIYRTLEGDYTPLPEDPPIRLPSWATDYAKQLLDTVHNDDIVDCYTIYHDCGKPHCRQVDEEGKQHFPDHATVSRRIWLEAGGNPKVAELILWDMVLHTMKSDEIPHYLQIWTPSDACTLLLVALAEIHSNAALFGGIETVSFKSKFKQLDRRGRAILKAIFGE